MSLYLVTVASTELPMLFVIFSLSHFVALVLQVLVYVCHLSLHNAPKGAPGDRASLQAHLGFFCRVPNWFLAYWITIHSKSAVWALLLGHSSWSYLVGFPLGVGALDLWGGQGCTGQRVLCFLLQCPLEWVVGLWAGPMICLFG